MLTVPHDSSKFVREISYEFPNLDTARVGLVDLRQLPLGSAKSWA